MAKGKKKKAGANPFKKAVDATPEIANCYQAGLGALTKVYKGKINLDDGFKCQGSVDIDACVQAKYPQANRWDYTIGYDGKAYFVEVHTASTSEVRTVLRKLQWLKDWLNTKGPELNKIRANKPFYWIQSDGFHVDAHSRQYRLAAQAGILPIARLTF